MSLTHTLYIGHDNEQALELLENDQPLAPERYTAITRVRIELADVRDGTPAPALDTQDDPQLITWSDARLLIEGARLSEVDGLQPGLYRGRVIVYATDQPEGVVFLDYHDYYLVLHTGGDP